MASQREMEDWSLPKTIVHTSATITPPVDFTLDGGNVNFQIIGDRLWMCIDGHCMLRIKGFKNVTCDHVEDPRE